MGRKCGLKIGERFGKMLVVDLYQSIEKKGNKMGPRLYCQCECDCGKVLYDVRPHDLTSGHTTSCGCARKKPKAYERRILRNVKARAKKTGLPFDLTLDDIEVPEVCPLLGIPVFPSKGYMTDNSPALDRKVPKLGYVKGNVWIISSRANRIKTDATTDEIIRVGEALLKLEEQCSNSQQRH